MADINFSGTLEGTGPNAKGSTSGNVQNLGYTWIGNNANGNPPIVPISPGIGGKQWGDHAQAYSGLTNESVRTADTVRRPIDSGTLENGNEGGANWR